MLAVPGQPQIFAATGSASTWHATVVSWCMRGHMRSSACNHSMLCRILSRAYCCKQVLSPSECSALQVSCHGIRSWCCWLQRYAAIPATSPASCSRLSSKRCQNARSAAPVPLTGQRNCRHKCAPPCASERSTSGLAVPIIVQCDCPVAGPTRGAAPSGPPHPAAAMMVRSRPPE